MSVFSDQKKFMEACDMKILDEPRIDPDVVNLWYELIHEEYEELMEAVEGKPITNIAQESIDLIYVVCGLLNGLGVDGQAVWNEVQAANMRKVNPETGKVTKRSDGKILKPDGWVPADIHKAIHE